MRDQMRLIAEELGVLDSSIMYASLNNRFGSEFLYNKAEYANHTFFKWTGLEYVTNLTRIMATSAGVSFIKAHALRAAEGNAKSKEFLKELNLEFSDIKLDEDGELIVSKHGLMAAGLSENDARQLHEKLQIAMNV